MSSDISVILPFFNEKSSAEKTLNLLYQQTIPPKEILFIDSNSTDETSHIIKNFINKKNLITWKIYKTNLKTPSEAKNYGISKSNFEWCAFMDFDIKFSLNWIEDQINFLSNNKNILISFGVINLNPENYFDKIVICQTYGINSNAPVIPSSFINKNYFKKNGIFLPYRSFYDKIFIKNSLKNKSDSILINYNNSICYFDVNYALNLKELFNKTLNYTIQSVYIKKNFIPYVYLILLFFFVSTILVNVNFIYYFFLILFFLRGVLIPIKKNKSFFKIFKLRDLPIIFFIGIFIDITKCIGFVMGLALKTLKKKIRLDHLYK
tara:strand:+ start:77 stop:1039 length:963 start_codon:yes stop_codon:yes gene_type:complete